MYHIIHANYTSHCAVFMTDRQTSFANEQETNLFLLYIVKCQKVASPTGM